MRFRTLHFQCTNFSTNDPRRKNFEFNTIHTNQRYYENSMSNILQIFDPWGFIIILKYETTLEKHLTKSQSLTLEDYSQISLHHDPSKNDTSVFYHFEPPRPNSREIREHFIWKQTEFLRFRTLHFQCTNFSTNDPRGKNFGFNTIHTSRRYYENSMSNILQIFDPWGFIIFLKYETTLEKQLTKSQSLALEDYSSISNIMAKISFTYLPLITFNHVDPIVEK